MVMEDLAELYSEQGRYAQSEPLFAIVLSRQQRLLGEEHPDTLLTITNLARTYRRQGKYTQAEPLYLKAVNTTRRVLGEEHAQTLWTIRGLIKLYVLQGNYVKAEQLCTQLLHIQRPMMSAENPDSLATLNDLGSLYLKQEKYRQAEKLLRDGLTKQMASDTWLRYNCESLLGASLTGQKRYAEAEPLLLSSYEGMMRLKTTIPPYEQSTLTDGRDRLVRLYERWGKTQKAAAWRNLNSSASANSGKAR